MVLVWGEVAERSKAQDSGSCLIYQARVRISPSSNFLVFSFFLNIKHQTHVDHLRRWSRWVEGVNKRPGNKKHDLLGSISNAQNAYTLYTIQCIVRTLTLCYMLYMVHCKHPRALYERHAMRCCFFFKHMCTSRCHCSCRSREPLPLPLALLVCTTISCVVH